ncbi:cyclase family protein [Aurantibacillus circumpalustris]|uniref:cyclase family protein n=1 Tax=Aurantibacillus circumpalustris TaxID=3036359 RepID=UPI00295B8D12|nr:cyclase family protein [Aurantibacillus circumpalustris]
MIATIFHAGKEYKIDFFKPIDISIPLVADKSCVSAWYVEPMSLEPVVMGDWIGDVNQGGSVNFRNIKFNPHGNGTHTECVGHISKEFYTINKNLNRFMFVAEVITVLPQVLDSGDFVITRKQLETLLSERGKPEAIVIRTLSNGLNKLTVNYSNTNPPYVLKEAIDFLNELGVVHLLIDMPSIDKESDGGKLEAHHAFWNYPQDAQLHKTITEFIYVPNEIEDGTYILNLQIAPFENDASPSKPILYKVF